MADPPLSKLIRDAIAKSDLPLLQVAKRANVHYSVIHRLMRGQKEPTTATVDKIVNALGLRIEIKRKRR